MQASDTVNISIDKIPKNVLPEDTVKCKEENLKINIAAINGDKTWQDGVSGNFYTIKSAGRYELTVNNACGVFTYPVSVSEKDCKCSIYFPNAFSPNNDGMNDIFNQASNCQIQDYSLSIYNRWGQRIYHTSDPDIGWNGKLKTRKVPEGLYFWAAKYTLKSEGIKIPGNQSGKLMLLR